MSRRDWAARLLGWSVRLLPAARREWGRAMLAELAALPPGAARGSFALSCTRAVLVLPTTMRRLAVGTGIAAVVVGAAGIRAPAMRYEVLVMVAVLTAVAGVARRRSAAPGRTAALVGAGAVAGVATDVVWLVADARLSPRSALAGPVVGVWTAMLAVYVVAFASATRRSSVAARTLAAGAFGGVAAAAGWLAAAAADATVPASTAPAVVAIAAAAVGAGVAAAQRRIAALTAAAGAALLIAVMLDGPLRAFPRWVPNSAPPLDHPATRLVDPIGVWLLGCALAAMLTVAVRGGITHGRSMRRRPRVQRSDREGPRPPRRGCAPIR